MSQTEDSGQIKKLVIRCATAVRTKQSNSTEMARAIIHEAWSKLSETDKVTLAVSGLARKTDTYNHHVRSNSRNGQHLANERKETKKKVLTKGRERLSNKVREIVYAALSEIALDCDGQMKSLLDFNNDDVFSWQTSATIFAGAWRIRTEFFTKAQKEMNRIEAKRLGDLPAPILKDLDAMAAKAWDRADANVA